MKSILARAALVTLGLLLGLALLEAALQLTAPLLRPAARSIDSQASGLRILCIGDSHTYGIWVDPADTYPARLQRKVADWPVDVAVLNAGVPGMNSSQVSAVLPDLLHRFRPDVALVMVGVADFWNLDSFRAEEYRGWRWVAQGAGLWERSRVVKLALLIRANILYGRDATLPAVPSIEHTPVNWRIRGGGEEIDVDIDMHFDDGLKDIVVFRRMLQRNLSRIAAAAEAQGVTLVLMTYATGESLYGAVNEVYRQFAAANGIPLIDLAAEMSPWSRPPLLAKAFFPDFHPRRAGYEVSARIVEGEMRRMLAATADSPGEVRRSSP